VSRKNMSSFYKKFNKNTFSKYTWEELRVKVGESLLADPKSIRDLYFYFMDQFKGYGINDLPEDALSFLASIAYNENIPISVQNHLYNTYYNHPLMSAIRHLLHNPNLDPQIAKRFAQSLVAGNPPAVTSRSPYTLISRFLEPHIDSLDLATRLALFKFLVATKDVTYVESLEFLLDSFSKSNIPQKELYKLVDMMLIGYKQASSPFLINEFYLFLLKLATLCPGWLRAKIHTLIPH
jgi:hypothetical protein